MSISDESKDRQICCSFCGKPQEQARRLIGRSRRLYLRRVH